MMTVTIKYLIRIHSTRVKNHFKICDNTSFTAHILYSPFACRVLKFTYI